MKDIDLKFYKNIYILIGLALINLELYYQNEY